MVNIQPSKNYEKVKKYYKEGNWTIQMVRNAVVKCWITEAEFKEIIEEDY